MDGSGKPDWRKNSDDSGILKTAEFESQQYATSSSSSKTNDFCPYSIREGQLSTDYKYDVLLIYDPEENSYFLDKLMEYLVPQNLQIFDFARDAPPGLPQRKVLQSALKVCRYTCIVITKKFISNFWLQLRTDMSIQDMLDNEEKMYSVIVVVMDSEVKKTDLPLDLTTISPLFYSEKFFENRIKLAFSKTVPFPSVQPSLQPKAVSLDENLTKGGYSLEETACFDSTKLSNNIENSVLTNNTDSKNRAPCEHGDGTFVMPPSICPTMDPLSYESSSMMHRTISVTVSSTGRREPQEMSDSSNQTSLDSEKQKSLSETEDSVIVKPSFLENRSSEDSYDHLNDIFSPTCYREGNFSFQSNSTIEQSILSTQETTTSSEFARPAFFSMNNPSVISTNDSVLTELEISEDSLPRSIDHLTTQSIPPNSNTMTNYLQVQNKNLKLDDELSCSSLPAKLSSEDDAASSGKLTDKKKSRSMRSLFGSKFFKTLSFRQKNK